jgi:hypothetical protein
MSRRRSQRKRVRTTRALAIEPLELRAVPAASALHIVLDIGDNPFIYVGAAALLPDGRIRIAGGPNGTGGTVWDFDRFGNRINQRPLGLLPDDGR